MQYEYTSFCGIFDIHQLYDILVTGSAGFIGGYIAEAIAGCGYNVTVLGVSNLTKTSVSRIATSTPPEPRRTNPV
ncbi:NAD-dependent epimerase/dehydratase family protein [Natrinema sp. HArc-T2]|uniref:NAD-dependent epimerase/dehydratase family protein n=1 Tax=Natrinema sp. HArc-T2 TaxID=3242701 RepID=UPI00359E5AD2